MSQPLVKRYFAILNQHKGIALTCVALGLGVSGVMAIRPLPPPLYKAEGLLSYNRPAVTFSNTAPQIQDQGQKLSQTLLLSDNVVQSVAAQVDVDPQTLRDRTLLKIPQSEQQPTITINYLDENPQQAAATLKALMDAMIQQSQLINTSRLRGLLRAINERLVEVEAELTATEQQLREYSWTENNSYSEYQRERDQLEKRVQLKQALYDKVQTTLVDAEAAEAEIVSSLGITQPPRLAEKIGSNRNIPLLLLSGLAAGSLVALGVLLFLSLPDLFAYKTRQNLYAPFFQLLKEGDGKVSLLRFALETKLPAEEAKQFLEQQAKAFNGHAELSNDGKIFYYFPL